MSGGSLWVEPVLSKSKCVLLKDTTNSSKKYNTVTDKDKEASFNVAYNVTDNISS